MTEELKQKAIKASDKKCVKGCSKYYRYGFQDGYIAGATELQEIMKKDLVSKLKGLISYSTSPSCTKGMELFIKGIEDWEFVK